MVTLVDESIFGRKKWFLNGKLHRDNDKPAVQNEEGLLHAHD